MTTESRQAATTAQETLANNATAFFQKIYSAHKSKMRCSEGCSQCCYTTLSVFESEAQIILNWFKALPKNVKSALQENLKKQVQPERDGIKPCAFLVENSCSIYPARPIICRTQGAPLRFKTEDGDFAVDCCPLNFTEPEQFPPPSEWLDLDRLMTLQSIAENSFQKEQQDKTLTKLRDEQGRIPLERLRGFLLTL